MIIYPQFNEKKEFFKHLHENKNKYADEKMEKGKIFDPKTAVKLPPLADKSRRATNKSANKNTEIVKATTEELLNSDALRVLAAINTTNYFDSHRDVHINGIWDNSLKRNSNLVFLEGHHREFANIIAKNGDLKVYTQLMRWAELGFQFGGQTQVLTFDAIVRKSINEFMFNKYAIGYIDQHSVGMQYVKLGLAINDESYVAEYDLWLKYIDDIANKEEVEEYGFYWAVTEANAIEGSAVVLGSNPATPTINVSIATNKALAEGEKQFNLIKAISETKILT